MSESTTPVKGISRRSFLKTSAAVAGVAAVGGGATMTALAASDAEGAGTDEHEVVCVCGCNCQGNCSIVATDVHKRQAIIPMTCYIATKGRTRGARGAARDGGACSTRSS